jgi:L-amino acid N-acyltransferase YncA
MPNSRDGRGVRLGFLVWGQDWGVVGDADGGVEFRLATADDWAEIWPIWRQIVDAGRTYTWPPGTDEATAQMVWMLPAPAEVWVAAQGGRIVGSAVLKPNQPGLGNHVAHAAFMVDPALAGRGIGRALADHILQRARTLGYRAMQFNAVVADNPAVALWRSLGFTEAGRVPDGFRRADGAFVDLLVLHRRL